MRELRRRPGVRSSPGLPGTCLEPAPKEKRWRSSPTRRALRYSRSFRKKPHGRLWRPTKMPGPHTLRCPLLPPPDVPGRLKTGRTLLRYGEQKRHVCGRDLVSCKPFPHGVLRRQLAPERVEGRDHMGRRGELVCQKRSGVERHAQHPTHLPNTVQDILSLPVRTLSTTKPAIARRSGHIRGGVRGSVQPIAHPGGRPVERQRLARMQRVLTYWCASLSTTGQPSDKHLFGRKLGRAQRAKMSGRVFEVGCGWSIA